MINFNDLNWSDVIEPNESCRYDHVFLETPIGKFQIEWKSWKEYDSYTVFYNDECIENEYSLDSAKQFCLFFLEKKLKDLIEFLDFNNECWCNKTK